MVATFVRTIFAQPDAVQVRAGQTAAGGGLQPEQVLSDRAAGQQGAQFLVAAPLQLLGVLRRRQGADDVEVA